MHAHISIISKLINNIYLAIESNHRHTFEQNNILILYYIKRNKITIDELSESRGTKSLFIFYTSGL